jgi:hypothetical protein
MISCRVGKITNTTNLSSGMVYNGFRMRFDRRVIVNGMKIKEFIKGVNCK